LRVSQRGSTQRYMGHPALESWSARTNPAGLGGLVIVVLLVLGSILPSVASAASHGPAANPSPQPAPQVSGGGVAAPDPAPQAAVRRQPSHSTPPGTSRSVSAVVAPRVVHTTSPASTAPASTGTAVSRPSTVSSSPVVPRPAAPHRPPKISHPVSRHRAAVHRPESHPIALSFPLAFILKDLLRLPHAALHAGGAGHSDGVLLLLSSVAMGVLAVASFTLMRRLKRLEGQVR